MPQDTIDAVREVAALASGAPEHLPGPTSSSAFASGPPLQWPPPGQADFASGHRVHAVVMGLGYRSLGVPLAPPLEVDADLLCHRVSAAIPDGDRLRDGIIVPACRQLHAGSLAFLQVPSWIAFSAKRAVVVDLTAFSEPVFSVLVPAELGQDVLASIAAEHNIEPWEVYLDGSYLPTGPKAHVSMALSLSSGRSLALLSGNPPFVPCCLMRIFSPWSRRHIFLEPTPRRGSMCERMLSA